MIKKNKARVILASDIGGTNIRLGLFSVSGGNLHSLSEQTFSRKNYNSVEMIISAFLR